MKNQIPFLHPSRRVPGAVYHWKPSPRLRKAGWTNLMLGGDWDAAIDKARARNREVEAWQQAQADAPGAAPAAAPRRLRWRQLAADFLADPAFTGLKLRSRAEYRSRMRTLTAWAQDGELILADLDRQMVLQLRDTLVADGRKHRTAALLRVLRILLNFAARKGWVAEGLAAAISIPEAPSRKRIVPIADTYRLIERASRDGEQRLALAILLAFWTLQREGDLLALNRLAWREMKDMSAFARKILAGPDGLVFGFRVQQGKTGAWVDLPLPWAIRQEVEAGFAAATAAGEAQGRLLPGPAGKGAWADWAFQRAFKRLVAAEGLADVQFRDLRRSGMVFSGEMGVEIQFITARSGHAVLGNKRTILDTYMPGNSRFAAEGMAIAWSRWQATLAEEEAEREMAE